MLFICYLYAIYAIYAIYINNLLKFIFLGYGFSRPTMLITTIVVFIHKGIPLVVGITIPVPEVQQV